MRRCFPPERGGMHYLTRRPYRMQKRKFSVTCTAALFWKLH
jgi:hypothetical protein